MTLKILLILTLSLSQLNVNASEIKIPKETIGIKEIEAFKKELKYICISRIYYYLKIEVGSDHY